MKQLNKDQMNVFARAIMPELYRLQKRHDRRTDPTSSVYHLNDPNDLALLIQMLGETRMWTATKKEAAYLWGYESPGRDSPHRIG